jgi:hypothetical protein
MHKFRNLTALAIGGSIMATAACTTNPETGRREISRTAVGAVLGAGAGYLLGDVIGGRSDRTERIIGAGIGAIAGGLAAQPEPIWIVRKQSSAARQPAPASM